MSVSRADAKKRIVLPAVKPGDVFDIQKQADGCFLLVRLERPKSRSVKSRNECLEAINKTPLTPSMGWPELRRLTREP